MDITYDPREIFQDKKTYQQLYKEKYPYLTILEAFNRTSTPAKDNSYQ